MALPALLMGASLGASVLGGVSSFFGRRAQARQQQLQADRMRAETVEEVRRLRLEQGKVLGETRAVGAASGIEADSSSLTSYLGVMSAEMRKQSEWALKAGLESARDVELGANSMSRAAGIGLVGDIGGALFQFGSANNWWKKQ